MSKGDRVTFDPSLTARNHINDCFHILALHPTPQPTEPAFRHQHPRPEQGLQGEIQIIYTDGSCKDNGKLTVRCGAGVWFDTDDPRNKAIRVPGDEQSNQTGEIAVIVVALLAADPTTPTEIRSDSMYAINGLNKPLDAWENMGWVGLQNATWFQYAAYLLCMRTAPTMFQWIKGHNGNQGNEEANTLAHVGANKPTPDDIQVDIPQNFQTIGAKLPGISQALAYKLISSRNRSDPSRSATINLDVTKHTIHKLTGAFETDHSIWINIRNPDIRHHVQSFIYKAMNRALHIGPFWSNIPTLEHRGKCALCDAPIETLEHILIECPSPERKTIWDLV
jgi:ribonuclease HI